MSNKNLDEEKKEDEKNEQKEEKKEEESFRSEDIKIDVYGME